MLSVERVWPAVHCIAHVRKLLITQSSFSWRQKMGQVHFPFSKEMNLTPSLRRQATTNNSPVTPSPWRHDLNQTASTKVGAIHPPLYGCSSSANHKALFSATGHAQENYNQSSKSYNRLFFLHMFQLLAKRLVLSFRHWPWLRRLHPMQLQHIDCSKPDQ